MSQPLLSSKTELDGPWDEHTLKTELKYLKSYQRQERELYIWLKAGGYAILEECAPRCGLDMDTLTVEAIEKVPNLPEVVREGFLRTIKWYILKKRIMQLVEYDAQQKQKKQHLASLVACT